MKRFKQFVKESSAVDEDLASSFMKTMHAAGKTNVRLVDRDQKRRETDELMRKRAADAAKRPAEPAHRSAEKYPLGGADEKSGRSYSEEVEGVAEDLDEASAAWQRKEGKNPTGGLNRKGIASYRRENPGSKLSMAVTTEPSKLKKGSKAWNRRKSFCARMGGMPGPMKDEKGRPTRKALSLRKWNC